MKFFSPSSSFSLSCVFLTSILHGCGDIDQISQSQELEAWRNYDAPVRLSSTYNKILSDLPTRGQLEEAPWSDSYWPSTDGGIAARWNSSDPQNFFYTSPSLSQLKSMSSEEIAELSPAEKYDILNGRYDYPTVRSEWSRTSPNDEGWEGLCHGWAPAAARFSEPSPVVVSNEDGVQIPFGSSDIKALLTYYQGNVSRAPSRFLGQRCNVRLSDLTSNRANRDDCAGVNPGAFHVVRANQIGIRKESFMADVTRDFEVWNWPVYSFSSEISPRSGVSASAAPGTVKEYDVTTQMVYSVEISPQWNPMAGFESSYLSSKTYHYTLEVNAQGAIIGGTWKSYDRPDFLWNQDAAQFRGYFTALEHLYRESIGMPIITRAPLFLPLN